jgi:GNAT superfamily N-acetyltransferase
MTHDARSALHNLATSVEIRAATYADIPAIVTLGRAFFTASDMGAIAAFCEESLGASLHRMIASPDAILLVAEVGDAVVGMAGAMTFPAYWNAAIKIGQESFWWVQPPHRGAVGPLLMAGLEREAKERGARTFLMVSLEALRPAAVAKLYERAGYLPLEYSFWKAL